MQCDSLTCYPPAEAERVYRFPLFEKSFCDELLEELEHFEQSSAPKGRPNTMNHYGVTSPPPLSWMAHFRAV